MATKKIGTVLKEARTAAGLTQEQLARRVSGVSAADLGRVERGEADFTQAQLKAIAKVLGVTQASLLNAAKAGEKKTEAAKKKDSAKKTDTAKKTETAKKKETAKKTDGKEKSSSAKKEEEIKLSAAEKKLLELYRAADKDTKEAAMKVLKGEKLEGGLLSLLSGGGGGLLDGVTDLLGLGKK